ncbi:MAG: hypothetical protein ABIE47_01760 [Pseudomonadota bacterium]|jgi:hypothetical protein|nr:hypothetical protein [Desulfobacteraceae bacterium]MBL7171419.1 hypothetical protein [Desulfobacteraceae bacterium]MBU0989215.1 hypothetical protein [Pseudomonadota bacterium]
MPIDQKAIEAMYKGLTARTRSRLNLAVKVIVEAKERGGKVVAVVGSGPNIHEGVTTLIAELIQKGIIDGVSTSSAVINHEMAGTLEKVKRFDGEVFGFETGKLPCDGQFEVSMISKARLEAYQKEIYIDTGLYHRMKRAKGNIIIKVAGNMAYPTGLRTERLARDILALSKRCGLPFEQVAGYGADPYTMIGAGALKNVPVLVTVPQMIGGGEVGLAVGDSIPVSERCQRVAELLNSADVIIESALALSQEIHDGPFELFTGHGIWSDWEGGWTYSLREKKIVRIDLDPNLEKAWNKERESGMVSDAVHKGLPKTKSMRIPFRMEMSGFARIPGSVPVVGDIGEIWPIMATKVAEALGVKLDLMSYKQSLPAGQEFREWIVRKVAPVDRERMFSAVREFTAGSR